ncbi:YdhR family protein [Flagellimonas sp. DF-77]|uniref:YdhR family protein n=1 Tax=Flagellimonas algarum TaxID=3230298 RepID=UPI00339350F1
MILQFIRLRSKLPEAELLQKAKEREPRFRAIPGLLQKYYVKLEGEGNFGGVYVWDSAASMQAYKVSDLAKSIPEAYGVTEAPAMEFMDILFRLREAE